MCTPHWTALSLAYISLIFCCCTLCWQDGDYSWGWKGYFSPWLLPSSLAPDWSPARSHFLSLNKLCAPPFGRCLLQPQAINAKQSSSSLKPVVCGNTQKKDCFSAGMRQSRSVVTVKCWREKRRAYHWVGCPLGQRAGQLNPKWSIEDKEPVVNELMVETAMFPFCWH